MQNILKYQLHLKLLKGGPSPIDSGIYTKATPILKLRCKISS